MSREAIMQRMRKYLNAHAPLSTEHNDPRFQPESMDKEEIERARQELRDLEQTSQPWEKNLARRARLPLKTIRSAVNEIASMMEQELTTSEDGLILITGFGDFRRRKTHPSAIARYAIRFSPHI